MNTSLYVLANEYREAAEQMADLDMPAEVIADTLDGLSGDLTTKATNVAMFVRNLEAMAANIKAAEQDMAARRKAIESRAASVKKYLLDNMQLSGIKKIDSPHFCISLRSNPPSVVIDDESVIPAYYMREISVQYAPDKALIKQAIGDGYEVPGCHIERTVGIVIK